MKGGGLLRSPDKTQPRISDVMPIRDGQPKSSKRTSSPSWPQGRHQMTMEDLAQVMYEHHASSTQQSNTTQQQITALHTDINTQMSALQQKVSALEEIVESQGSRINELTRERDKLSDELRRSNLIFHGLPETVKSQKEIEQLISTILPPALVGLQIQVDAPFRLGKTAVPGKCRPVKVHFPFLSHRSAVLNIRRQVKLPGANILITEDLCLSTREERKQRWIEKNQQTPSPQTGTETISMDSD